MLSDNYTDLLKYFSIAIEEVVHTMAGFEISASKDPSFFLRDDSPRISGLMLLPSSKNAILSITVSLESASILVSYMTGIPVDELKEEDLYDGVIELVNMIAGRAKSLLIDTTHSFGLTAPFAIYGRDYELVLKKNVSNLSKKYVSGDLEIGFGIFFM